MMGSLPSKKPFTHVNFCGEKQIYKGINKEYDIQFYEQNFDEKMSNSIVCDPNDLLQYVIDVFNNNC